MQKNLHQALKPLRRTKKLKVQEWYDGCIRPGCEWEPNIIENLKLADVILLLLTPAFIDSPYCYEKELESALQRHRQGIVRVIPVLLRDIVWRDHNIAIR